MVDSFYYVCEGYDESEVELHVVVPIRKVDRAASWAPDAGADEEVRFAFYYGGDLECEVRVGPREEEGRLVYKSLGHQAWLDLLYAVDLMKSERMYPESEGLKIWVQDGHLYILIDENTLRAFKEWSFGVTEHILNRGRRLRFRFYYPDSKGVECEVENEANILIYKTIDKNAWLSLLDIFSLHSA